MKKHLWIALLCAGVVGHADAGTYEWTSAWTQGVTENLVDDGNGNELNISCPDENRPVQAFATIAGKAYTSGEEGSFDVIVDGVAYSNPFYTDCHVCAQNFPSFWKALRNANNLQLTADGKTIKLPTKNLKTVLLPLDSPENSCRAAW